MPATSQNRLAGATSPYLLQHADNPVAWLPWDATAIERARAEDRPILLSIGYSACHWCHVMAHESFEDEATAAVMNRLFVNIKVDREERPDLDQIYQTAHQLLTGRPGGWPLTMFLTPDGVPFFGGTYFPPEPRHGLPGFADLCERVGEAWRAKRKDIEAQNREVLAALSQPTIPHAEAQLDAGPLDALRTLLIGSVDRRHGGFGAAPKFPHPTDLTFLLGRTDDAAAHEAALYTLRCMAQGGIHDQIGGGFCRYSVDERWEIPHFEKMLYDNALLLGNYADAWALTGESVFARAAEGIVAWLSREMTDTAGGFYSSLDADSEGEEGRYYVWTRSEIESVLTPQESALAGRHWGLAGPPNFEERYWHLKVAAPLEAEDVAVAEAARAKLFSVRQRRVRPGCDDKVLTSWNALMIEGLAHAGRIFRRPEWITSARLALDFLRSSHWQAEGGGRLLATSRGGQARLPAYLDDYAFLLAALLELLQTEFRPEELRFASQLADALLECFEDHEAGGFFFTAHDHEALIQRLKPAHDTALPAGNGVAAWALQRLGHLLGEMRYLEAARRTIDAFWPQLAHRPAGCASLLRALEEALVPPTVVILRGPAAGVADWRQRLASRRSLVIVAIPNGEGSLLPALAKPETPDVNAWVCRGVNCLAPIGNFDVLAEACKNEEFR
jgi:uncharacterized protein YyaL (SSP411 family)